MPVKVEDGLAFPLADVDDDAVVVQSLLARRLGDEVEHPFGLVRPKVPDVMEARDVTLRKDEQMHVCLGIDVPDRDETFGRRDMLSLLVEAAEEAVLRQRRSLPP
jgi:hypothetical protein